MLIHPDKCPCCKSFLHHCEHCWNKHHNGLRDNDYIPPAYYGELIFHLSQWNDDLGKKLIPEILDMVDINITAKPDKSRPYTEGDYGHEDTP